MTVRFVKVSEGGYVNLAHVVGARRMALTEEEAKEAATHRLGCDDGRTVELMLAGGETVRVHWAYAYETRRAIEVR